jgi:superfamily II DNA or RNA helicase
MNNQLKRRKLLDAKKKEVATATTLSEEKKGAIRSASYLGKKGYTIPREILGEAELEFLHTNLFMKPVTVGPTYGPQDECAFPVYRENAKKIYIPRFYGIQRYGLPNNSEMTSGDAISVDFPKPLRDYQDKIVDVYMKHVSQPICSGSEKMGGGGILEVPCGRGKTVLSLKLISILKKKTLIIVHKEFLMNQWIDRANEFLPGAKIGKIQGPVFDVEGKDLVIGMLQTLYDRALPENAFDSFGLTIVDEVHRIGSEQFSKTLLRVLSPNMLGISATVDRKDKLTDILYMFIGPKIYTEERDSDDPVCVRAIEYISSDPQFNETEYDFRGQAKYSTMISKLSDFGPRSDFIVRVLGDLVKESQSRGDGAQIMVLCHNRSLLKYLYEAIVHRGFASVGYYVGGMKQAALQETEGKQIVLATYAMAAEALDIKTLSVLLMASPKTDITQSVGRILRVRHDNPVIVDIVDRHDIFQNQWRQRKTFYRKCNYRILSMDSVRYQGMSLDWKTDKTWTKVFEPRGSTNTEDHPILQKKCLISIKDLDIDEN